MKAIFRQFTERVSLVAGTPWAFITALAVILGWGACGPFFGFSEHWQLIVHSITTIATFLMVFIIQNTQNRDFQSLHLKLDALLHASEKTPRGLMNLHNLADEDLHRLEQVFERLARRRDIEEIVRSLENSTTVERQGN